MIGYCMTGECITALLLSAFCLIGCCLLPMDELCQRVFTIVYHTTVETETLFLTIINSQPFPFQKPPTC